jgi:hypothetical protein
MCFVEHVYTFANAATPTSSLNLIPLSCDNVIQHVHSQTKFKTIDVLERHKMSLKEKSKMPIPLCQMISTLVVKLALKIDILKMEQAFHGGYKEGDKMFYVSSTNGQGGVESIVGYEMEWNS